ncbi:hypothetical protein BC831DRAFT_472337 [Entophlyctis helioformis]|nr:hypothetical protein BC831DRAFT_472337 [Entophlyctis helioformis]
MALFEVASISSGRIGRPMAFIISWPYPHRRLCESGAYMAFAAIEAAVAAVADDGAVALVIGLVSSNGRNRSTPLSDGSEGAKKAMDGACVIMADGRSMPALLSRARDGARHAAAFAAPSTLPIVPSSDADDAAWTPRRLARAWSDASCCWCCWCWPWRSRSRPFSASAACCCCSCSCSWRCCCSWCWCSCCCSC